MKYEKTLYWGYVPYDSDLKRLSRNFEVELRKLGITTKIIHYNVNTNGKPTSKEDHCLYYQSSGLHISRLSSHSLSIETQLEEYSTACSVNIVKVGIKRSNNKKLYTHLLK